MHWTRRQFGCAATAATLWLATIGQAPGQSHRQDETRFERLVQQVRFVHPRHANGIFSDLEFASFESVWERFEFLPGGELTIPVVLPNLHSFEDFIVSDVRVSIDRQRRSFIISRDSTQSDFLFGGVWGPEPSSEGHFLFGLKLPRVTLGELIPDFPHSILDDPGLNGVDLEHAVLALTNAPEPLRVSAFAGAELGLYQGMDALLSPARVNFFQRVDAADRTFLYRPLQVLGFEPSELVFQGSMAMDPNLLIGAGIRDPAASLYWKAPLPVPETSPHWWPDWLRAARALQSNLEVSYEELELEIWVTQILEITGPRGSRTFELATSLDPATGDVGATYIRTLTGPSGSAGPRNDWVTLEAAQSLAGFSFSDEESAESGGSSSLDHKSRPSPAVDRFQTAPEHFDRLTLAELRSLLQERLGDSFTVPPLQDGLPVGFLDLSGVRLEVQRGDRISATVTAKSSLLKNVETEVLISLFWDRNGTPDLLLSLRIDDLPLGALYPGSPAAGIRLPHTILSVVPTLRQGGRLSLPAANLDQVAVDFYRPMFGTTNFKLELRRGVNVLSLWPLGVISPLVVTALGLDPADSVLLEGHLGTTLAALAVNDLRRSEGIYLRANLPTPSRPPVGLPRWVESASLRELTVEVTYVDPKVLGRFGFILDAVVDGQKLVFSGSTTLPLGDPPGQFTITGAMEGTWNQPFRVRWLSLEDVGLLISFDPRAGIRGEFFGMFRLGETRLSTNIQFDNTSEVTTVRFTALADRLSTGQIAELLRQQAGISSLGPGFPATVQELRDVSIAFTSGPNKSLAVSGTADLDLQLDGQKRRFVVSVAVTAERGDVEVKVNGRLASAWQRPFGLDWLTLQEVSLELSGSYQAGNAILNTHFFLGGSRIDLRIELNSGTNGDSARLVGRADRLSMTQFTDLVRMQVGIAPLRDTSLVLNFRDVTLVLEVGDKRSFSILATTELNGKTADLLLSTVVKDGQTHLLTGFQLHNWSLSEAVPTLRGSLVDQVRFDTVALLLTKAEGRFDSKDLTPEVYAFYRKVNQVDDFTLKLQPGVSLVGIGPLPANLRPAMDKLGSSASKILLAGSLPGSVLGSSGGGLSIRASLPPMSPSLPNGQRPPWFRSGQLAFFVEVQAGSVSAGLDGTLNVIIDDTDMSFIVGGEFGGPPIAITLFGRLVTDRPWVAPFDGKFGDLSTKWLTIREVGVALSFNPVSASLGLGFDGDIDVGSKNLEIDVALSINVVTGVPTNFIFRGVSSTPFAIDDLVTLQQQMAKAAGRSGRLPAQNIPNIEIRPVDARTPLEVKFALRSTEQVKAGFALKGALWAELKPGGPLEALAVVAADISVAGISMSGTVPRDVTIGAFDLRQPTLNIEMALLPPLASFVVNGNVELPWFTRRLGFALSRSADVSEGLQKLGAIVAAWKDFSAAFQNDPIRALENSLSGSSGLFALAGVENPPWLAELFDVVAFMRSQFPGVGSRVLLEYSLTGVDVNIPPGQGFPEGGRTPQGCLPGQTLQDGRCWTITPFAGEEMGFSPFCPTGVLEGGRCWTVPPSATWTRAKVRRRSTCRRRNRLGACVQWNYVYVCPSGTTESGGSCYGNPPGPPRLARPSTPRQVCYGVEQGGKCWKVGRAPRAGTPRGGADQICPALTPIYANNRCWTVPPRPEIQVERIEGICRRVGISCSVDGLQRETISALIREAVEKLIEPFRSGS